MAAYDIEPTASISFTEADNAPATLLQAWHDLFAASNHWQVDNAPGGGSAGFTVSAQVGSAAQFNFRPSGTSILVVMDYQGSITDATTLAGAGDLSTEQAWTSSELNATGSFHEWVDAFTILSRNGTTFEYSLHAGKVFNPFFSGDPLDEMDGQGIMLGDVVGGSSSGLFGGGATSSKALRSFLHTGPASYDQPILTLGNPALADLSIGGRTQPVPMVASSSQGNNRQIGPYRYFWRWTSLTVGVVVRDSVAGKDLAALGNGTTGFVLMPVASGFDVLV